jgi:hypothetical protein
MVAPVPEIMGISSYITTVAVFENAKFLHVIHGKATVVGPLLTWLTNLFINT